jgi:hypothetical protein
MGARDVLSMTRTTWDTFARGGLYPPASSQITESDFFWSLVESEEGRL